ncbi:MAG: hypothetical protein ACOCZ8_05260, partial [Bacteroidota bacterium]
MNKRSRILAIGFGFWCAVALYACENRPGSTHEKLTQDKNIPEHVQTDPPEALGKPRNDRAYARELMESTIVELPRNRIVSSTSIDTELDEYLFTKMDAREQVAFQIQTVFGDSLRGLPSLPTPEVYAMGKRKVGEHYLVLFCAVHNTALHVYRLQAGLFDEEMRLVDQAYLGKLDFVGDGFRTRKYDLIFSPDKIEYAKGFVNQRRILEPCNVLTVTNSQQLKTYENTCS